MTPWPSQHKPAALGPQTAGLPGHTPRFGILGSQWLVNTWRANTSITDPHMYYPYPDKARVALPYLERLVHWRPKSADYRFRLGLAHSALQNHEEAAIVYQQAVELKPKSLLFYLFLTSELIKFRDTLPDPPDDGPNSDNRKQEIGSQAAAALRHCVELGHKKNFRALHHNLYEETQDELAKLFIAWGDKDEAVQAFRTVAEQNQTPANYNRLAVIQLAFQDWQEAKDTLEFGIKNHRIKPGSKDGLYYHLGLILWGQGKVDEAKEALQKATSYNPDAAPYSTAATNVLLFMELIPYQLAPTPLPGVPVSLVQAWPEYRLVQQDDFELSPAAHRLLVESITNTLGGSDQLVDANYINELFELV